MDQLRSTTHILATLSRPAGKSWHIARQIECIIEEIWDYNEMKFEETGAKQMILPRPFCVQAWNRDAI